MVFTAKLQYIKYRSDYKGNKAELTGIRYKLG